jgi:hypothetical protein
MESRRVAKDNRGGRAWSRPTWRRAAVVSACVLAVVVAPLTPLTSPATPHGDTSKGDAEAGAGTAIARTSAARIQRSARTHLQEETRAEAPRMGGR